MVDGFRDECGVVGVFGHPEAANLAYLALYALQHRGQEGAGIVSSDGQVLVSHRGLGLVNDVFNESIIRRLAGTSAIGHVRYSTAGETLLKNTQPLVVDYAKGSPSPLPTTATWSTPSSCASNSNRTARSFSRLWTAR